MRILGPKHVAKANSWCVTVFTDLNSTQSKKTSSQVQHWFSTEQEAKDFIKAQQEKE